MSRGSGLLERLANGRLLVVGDAMLDRWVRGSVERISPEAPVPVVRVRRESASLGGAANVAANIVALGARVSLAAIRGRDPAGAELVDGLRALGVEDLTEEDPAWPTTIKTRVLAGATQVLRVDREGDGPPADITRRRLLTTIERQLADSDGLVISDYDKGVLTPDVLRPMLQLARERGIPVAVDPKPRHLLEYQPVTVLTPNEDEAAEATGVRIRTDTDCVRAARIILDRVAADAVLVTRGERGMLLQERDGDPVILQTAAREVFDVTGAGDTVVAVVAMALAAGAGLTEAAELANRAAGIVVSRAGTAAVGPEELRGRLAYV